MPMPMPMPFLPDFRHSREPSVKSGQHEPNMTGPCQGKKQDDQAKNF